MSWIWKSKIFFFNLKLIWKCIYSLDYAYLIYSKVIIISAVIGQFFQPYAVNVPDKTKFKKLIFWITSTLNFC